MRQNVSESWNQKKQLKRMKMLEIKQRKMYDSLEEQLTFLNLKTDKISMVLESIQDAISDSISKGINENLIVQSENRKDIVKNIQEIKEFLSRENEKNSSEQKLYFEQLQKLIKNNSVVLGDTKNILTDSVGKSISKNLKVQLESRRYIVEAIEEVKKLLESLNAKNSSEWETNFEQLQDLMKIIIANDLLNPIVSELT